MVSTVIICLLRGYILFGKWRAKNQALGASFLFSIFWVIYGAGLGAANYLLISQDMEDGHFILLQEIN